MIEVRVRGMAEDVEGQYVLLLEPAASAAAGAGRILPIWIGQQEAASILIAVQGATPPRPLSHDLVVSVVRSLDARVARVEIGRIEARTFTAELHLETSVGARAIDARPSDAIAVACRAGAPIFVAESVLEEAGIPDPVDPGTGETELPEERLAEFRRFLDDVEPEDFED
ncbi:bifunctional nuclease family protein [Leucobacter triazinivorans]|uniref:Bifunctional nuclease family protein n=1 Tax=Leucobacter triazinivorans TaxID=1784719 RepID=A0A4P6KBM7_9MICO|nr:bifunctional nuclease family protein [Leucobacter triazinivorans]QBE47493.1 bifunctional nuclease family protein [Leucobacter triazinivorans]